jgi:hypothetical protein
LRRAYALNPVAIILYNAAKAHERAGELEESLSLYREFVSRPDAAPELRARAEARITALTDGLRSAPTSEPTSTVPAPVLAATPVDNAARSRRIYRGLGIGLLAGGVATLGIAIGLSVHARSLANDMHATFLEDDKRALRDSAVHFAAGADASYALSAALSAVSIYCLYRGYARPHAVAITPAISPTALSLSIGGSF